VVINYLVVPLTEIGRIPQFTAWTFGGNLLAMLGFGLLIAFFARGSLSR
jgi:glycopeptide antibiotics resistance protein